MNPHCPHLALCAVAVPCLSVGQGTLVVSPHLTGLEEITGVSLLRALKVSSEDQTHLYGVIAGSSCCTLELS